MSKVKGEDNLADALTKPVEGKLLSEHLDKVGSSLCGGRHKLAPLLDTVEKSLEDGEGDGECENPETY